MHTRLPYLANDWADCVQILCVTGYQLDRCFTHVCGGVHLHVRTYTPLFHISQTARRIAFIFGLWVQILCVTGYQLDRCFAHVCGGVHLHVRKCTPLFHISQTARRIAFKFGLWVQIWFVARDPLDKSFTRVRGGMRAHVHTRFPFLANGWADCVQTWCVASDSLDERLTQVRCGVHLHVRMYTPPSHDGASSPARPSPIKASYWLNIGVRLTTYSGVQYFYMTTRQHVPFAIRKVLLANLFLKRFMSKQH